MEENKNKVMLAVILGVVIVFAAVGTYLVFSKISTEEKEEETSNSNAEQVVNLDANSELVTKLISYVDIQTNKFYQNEKVLVNNLTMAEQYEMAFKEIDSTGITLGCHLEEMKQDSQTDIVSLENCSSFHYEIPEENLEKAMKQVLGNSAFPDKTSAILDFHFSTKWKFKDLSLQKDLSSFQEENFESPIGSTIYYDTFKKSYVGNYETQVVELEDNGIISKIESASQEGKKVSIVTKVIFIDLHPTTPAVIGWELEEYNIYSDLEYRNQIGTIKIEDYDFFLHSSSNKELESILEQYKENATTIVYTFEENEDGSYHFVSSEKK